MPSEVILPRVDMDMATGKIARWYVEDGAVISKGQPLFEIETDKAAMEIEAPSSGIIRDLADASGRDIPVGSVIAWIYADGEAAVAPARGAAPDVQPAVVAPPHEPAPGAAVSAAPIQSEALPGRPNATPLARRLAREQGLDLGAIAGSGPRGRIQAGDIAQARAARTPSTVNGSAAEPCRSDAAAVLEKPPVETRSPVTDAAPASRTTTVPAAGPLGLIPLRDGTGTPVLLIHGFGADANGWRPFLSGRSSARPIYALDLPGHGRSPLGAEASFDALVDAVEQALTASPLPTLHLVGHSLGGAIAATLAARGTLDIRSLLLLAPAGLGPAINGDFVRGYLAATSEAALTPWMRELTTDPAAITPAFIRTTLKAREGSDLVASQRRIAAAVFPDGTQSFSIRSALASLAMPTRVVVGTGDKIIPATQARGLPGPIAVHTFTDVGHMPQIEARDAVMAILTQMMGV